MTADPYVLFLAGLGAVVLLVAWLPLALKRAPLSLAILCVLIGLAVFGSGLMGFRADPRTYDTLTERLSELVVLIALMGAGLKLERPLGWRTWGATWRLLAIAMPLSIAAMAASGYYLLGFPLAMAMLFGAALAPTDPVLASDVQVGPPQSGEEGEVRFGLTSEAGLNDGLAFPFVMLAILFAAEGSPGAEDLGRWFAVDVLWRIACGVGMGWLMGRVLGWLAFGAPHAKLSRTGDGLVAIGATLLAYSATELLNGYGFLAVFVAARGIRSAERSHDYHQVLHDFAEQTERLLTVLLLMLFGGAVVSGLLAPLTWPAALTGLALILVIRPLTGYLSLLRAPGRRAEHGVIAAFGIRGIGSFYYLAYATAHAKFPDADLLWATVGFVVLVSVIVHGIVVTPVMQLLDRSNSRTRTVTETR